MNKSVAILLVGLLGFLGCSGDDDDTNTIGEAHPVAPFGITDTSTPTYEWTPVPWATKYRLVVEDINETVIIEEWYSAEEAGCDSEEDLCSVTPDVDVTGVTWKVLACAGEECGLRSDERQFSWKVLACAGEECGLWSDERQFSYAAAGPSPRFTDRGDGTVTDNYTRLIWSKNAHLSGAVQWLDAMNYCSRLTLAGQSDWRLPHLYEQMSLIDPNRKDPALPLGHPVTDVRRMYWTSKKVWNDPDSAWFVAMAEYGRPAFAPTMVLRAYAWPVRSGN